MVVSSITKTSNMWHWIWDQAAERAGKPEGAKKNEQIINCMETETKKAVTRVSKMAKWAMH